MPEVYRKQSEETIEDWTMEEHNEFETIGALEEKAQNTPDTDWDYSDNRRI